MHSPTLLIADGPDYTGGLLTATFSGSSTTSVRVPTLSDNVLEGLETFTGVIQVPPDTTTNYRVTAGSPDTAMVCIIDATSEFSIHATWSNYVCNSIALCRKCTVVTVLVSQPISHAVGVLLVAKCRVQVPSALWLHALPK